jgi:hypothetical protein
VPIFPDWGLDYEVVPDEQEEKARRENEALNHARSMIQRALGDGSARRMGEEPSQRDLYAMVEKALVADLISDSREIRAADRLVGDLQQRLGGEDPLDPEVRKTLDFCRAELAKMRDQQGVDADEAIEDCGKDLEMMREFIEKSR